MRDTTCDRKSKKVQPQLAYSLVDFAYSCGADFNDRGGITCGFGFLRGEVGYIFQRVSSATDHNYEDVYPSIPFILKTDHKHSLRQHTPNPEAHCPEARPFRRAHSFTV